jgi:hypothetical protein
MEMIRSVQFEYFSSGRVDSIAFMDTVTDKFIEINGEQHWQSKRDFDENFPPAKTPDEILFYDRLMSLCPLWFLDNEIDYVEMIDAS